jgi:hypothetical protein
LRIHRFFRSRVVAHRHDFFFALEGKPFAAGGFKAMAHLIIGFEPELLAATHICDDGEGEPIGIEAPAAKHAPGHAMALAREQIAAIVYKLAVHGLRGFSGHACDDRYP